MVSNAKSLAQPMYILENKGVLLNLGNILENKGVLLNPRLNVLIKLIATIQQFDVENENTIQGFESCSQSLFTDIHVSQKKKMTALGESKLLTKCVDVKIVPLVCSGKSMHQLLDTCTKTDIQYDIVQFCKSVFTIVSKHVINKCVAKQTTCESLPAKVENHLNQS